MQNKIHTLLFALGVIILGFLIWDFGINNIIYNIKKIGWWFLLLIFIWGCVYLINASAWYIILGSDRKKVTFSKIYGVSISGFAINYITPFINLGGEPYKIASLKDYLGLEKAISSVTLYRMVHILAHLLFWLSLIPVCYFILPDTAGFHVTLAIAFGVILFLVLFFFSRHRKGIFEAILNLLRRIPFTGFLNKKLERYRSNIVVIDEQIRDLFNNRKQSFYGALFLEYISRFVASVEFFFIMHALGISISFIQAFYIYAGSSLFLNIMFFMPLEMGTREGSLYLVFNAFNFNPEISIFVGLVNRTRELFWIVIGIALIQINNRKSKKQIKLDFPDTRRGYEGSNI